MDQVVVNDIVAVAGIDIQGGGIDGAGLVMNAVTIDVHVGGAVNINAGTASTAVVDKVVGYQSTRALHPGTCSGIQV